MGWEDMPSPKERKEKENITPSAPVGVVTKPTEDNSVQYIVIGKFTAGSYFANVFDTRTQVGECITARRNQWSMLRIFEVVKEWTPQEAEDLGRRFETGQIEPSD